MDDKIKSYEEFWPYYLREHSLPSTRAWHYFGTSFSIILLVSAALTARPLLIVAALICGYFFAWVSHGLLEKNKPATFTYPLWSLRSDFRMLFCFVTGKMRRELEKAGLS